MKYLTLAVVSIAVTCFFSSCRKEIDFDASQQAVSSNAKLKAYTEEVKMSGDHQFNTIRLYYDVYGRLTKMLSENTDEKFLYKYNEDFYTTEFYNADRLVNRQTSFLNSSLFIDSTIQWFDETSDLTEKYIYNSSGQLIRVNLYYQKKSTGASLYNCNNYSYDKSGNLIREANNNSVTTYDYHDQLTSNIFISAPYIQKPKSLVKTTTYVCNGVTEIFNHTYTFDNNKRLVSEKIVKSGSNDMIVRKFTY